MGLPAILVENYLDNVLQFVGHQVATSDANGLGAAGYEVYHLANGRRSPSDRYQADTANAARTITSTFDRVRYFNGLAIDRGHNLGGQTVSILISFDGFTTSETVWTGTIPSVLTSPGRLDNTNGVVTEEGAFLVRFPGVAGAAARLSLPALGANVTTQIVNAWLGMWMALPALYLPWYEDQADLQTLEEQSADGWLGRTSPVSRKEGELSLRLTDPSQEDQLRLHVSGHYLAAGRPMWIVMDDIRAERAFLALRPRRPVGFAFESGWWPHQMRVPYLEHEPLRMGG